MVAYAVAVVAWFVSSLCFMAGTVDYASNQSYLGTAQLCEAALIRRESDSERVANQGGNALIWISSASFA